MPQTVASIEELTAETCTAVGLTGSLDRSTKVKFTLACSTELRTALNRWAASQSPGQRPGKHQGEHLHSPSAAYSTKLFYPHSILPHMSVSALSDHCSVRLRSRSSSYSNTRDKAGSPNPLSKRQRLLCSKMHMRGSAPFSCSDIASMCATSLSTFTCHTYARSLS